MLGKWFRRNVQRVVSEEIKKVRKDAEIAQSQIKKLMARADRMGAQLSSCDGKIEAAAHKHDASIRSIARVEANIAALGAVTENLGAGMQHLAENVYASLANLDAAMSNLGAGIASLGARIPASQDAEIEALKVLSGTLAARHVRQLAPMTPLKHTEFRVFSQFGEDGIVQFLLAHVPIEREIFVEFGVENYAEANTRFLLVHNHWRGLIMDGSESAMAGVRASSLAWRHHLTAAHAWVTAENINHLIADHGISGDIGVLSIDVDGVDYWVWKAVEAIRPRIVICEYNALFGPTGEVTVPYDPAFSRSAAHYSWLFFGASLGALARLAETKGYQLVGVNSAGNNAFFVRKDVAGLLPARRPDEVFEPCRFREARNEAHELAFLDYSEAQAAIARCTVVELQSGVEMPLAEVPGWPGAST